MPDYLRELENCTLCEWRCGADRLGGERGVCRIGMPEVASAMLHPAPPESYTIFLAGCNLRCLNCQNWEIAHYPDTHRPVRGFVDPGSMAEEALAAIRSLKGRLFCADRIFFSGGSPVPSLPYVEEVVREARRRDSRVKVNFDTNGFMTEESLARVLAFSTSITYDVKAYHDDVHRALTGAPVAPVLRNAAEIATNAPEKLWEFRFLVIPGITVDEVAPVAAFIAEIDETLPFNLLAFRPNFVLEHHPHAIQCQMEEAVRKAREAGLANVRMHGYPGVAGERAGAPPSSARAEGGERARSIAARAGCPADPRGCGTCGLQQRCPIKGYRARRSM
ncbi:MAG: radical SAM protein [Methanomicrobiales archaeon]|nr:radical SAM protein [Methanomicrobiales archaeon]MDI6875789.1 radical SAM protein [Methanomicrobiales archaeon]